VAFLTPNDEIIQFAGHIAVLTPGFQLVKQLGYILESHQQVSHYLGIAGGGDPAHHIGGDLSLYHNRAGGQPAFPMHLIKHIGGHQDKNLISGQKNPVAVHVFDLGSQTVGIGIGGNNQAGTLLVGHRAGQIHRFGQFRIGNRVWHPGKGSIMGQLFLDRDNRKTGPGQDGQDGGVNGAVKIGVHHFHVSAQR